VLGRNPAHGCGLRAWRPADGARGGPFASRPTTETTRHASVWPATEAARLARTGRRSTHCVHSHCARVPRSGTTGGGSSLDGTRQGSRCKHHCSAAKVSGKRNGGGAHPSGDSTCRAERRHRCRGGSRRQEGK
jgi:hypothetical protein